MSLQPLKPSDHHLLHLIARIVPVTEREEWSRGWHAELWHLRHARRYSAVPSLTIGIASDALWLRGEFIRLKLEGTPALCLVSLLGIAVLSAVLGAGSAGSWQFFTSALADHLNVSLTGGVLVAFVAWATTFRRHFTSHSRISFAARLQALFFCAAKGVLLWASAFLLSTAVFLPIHHHLPVFADVFQVLDLVVFALAGLRWAFADQAGRCRQCLHTLAPPARIGRPSRNLLEWNGTELSCRHGHGLLSVPELETSWCDAGSWVQWSES